VLTLGDYLAEGNIEPGRPSKNVDKVVEAESIWTPMPIDEIRRHLRIEIYQKCKMIPC